MFSFSAKSVSYKFEFDASWNSSCFDLEKAILEFIEVHEGYFKSILELVKSDGGSLEDEEGTTVLVNKIQDLSFFVDVY